MITGHDAVVVGDIIFVVDFLFLSVMAMANFIIFFILDTILNNFKMILAVYGLK